MTKQQLFNLLGKTIKSSAHYNIKDKIVYYDHNLNSKILSILEKLGQNSVDVQKRIDVICTKIAQKTSTLIEQDTSSFTSTQCQLYDQLNNFNTKITTKYSSESFNDAKNNVLNSIKNNLFIEMQLSSNITDAVNRAIKAGNLGAHLDAISTLKDNSKNLDQYVKDMTLPTWFGEIFFTKCNNTLVANNNLEEIKKINKTDENAVLLDKCINNAVDVQKAMQKNNDLLAKIEQDINAKRDSFQRINDSLQKFTHAALDQVILNYFKENLSTVKILPKLLLNTPEYFQDNKQIDLYIIKNLANAEMEKFFADITKIKQKLGMTSGIMKDLGEIEKSFQNLKLALELEKQKLEYTNSPIPEEMFCFERSTWQSFKTTIASLSEFVIGEWHNKIFGYADGVEELRRLVLDIDNVDNYDIALLSAQL